MKTKRTPTVVESQPAAATLLKCHLRDIRRAKAAGCPAFEPGGRIRLARLKVWLSRHPARKRPASVAAVDLPRGFNAAFSRLLKAEASAFARMENETDEQERGKLRREWSALLVEVRKHSVVSEDFGDLVSRKEVEASLSVFAGYLHGEIRDELRALCPRLTGLAAPSDVAVVLDSVAAKVMQQTVSRAAACTAETRAGFPGWAKTSVAA